MGSSGGDTVSGIVSVVSNPAALANAVIGAATDDDRLVIRSLDNASVTTVNVDVDGSLTLLEGGTEADTLIR